MSTKGKPNKSPHSTQLHIFAHIRLMNLRLLRTGLFDEAAEKIKQPSEADLNDLETVEKTDIPEVLVDLCRKISFSQAKDTLVEIILTNQKNTMSLLIARYQRFSHDKFIELAKLALGYCKEKYVDELKDKPRNLAESVTVE